MNEQLQTKVFLLIGSVTGTTQMLQDMDLLAGIGLKIVSIISFVIVIAINLPKLVVMLKGFQKKG